MNLLTPGWRARIGLIYMHSSIVMEPEFSRMAPEGVSVHTTRIVLPKVVDKEGLTSLGESREIEACTALLAAAPLSAIIFGGTSASFIKGYKWDEAIVERMKRLSKGIPVTTTSTASLRALRSLHAKRIAIATPYINEVNERAEVFFRDNGFDVVDLKGLGLNNDHDIGNTTLDVVCNLVRSLRYQESDLIFISCTNLQTIGVLQDLEEDLQRPVVSAIQASFWDCLKLAGVNTASVKHFGSLFEERILD